jgi:hypothetical protein
MAIESSPRIVSTIVLAGGIYLFESEGAAQSYLDGPIVGALKTSPAVSNISAKLFDVLESHTAMTRGPVK